MRRLLLPAVFTLIAAPLAYAQEVIIPSPVPAVSASCVLQYNASTGKFDCNALGAVSQPLTDSLGLIANQTDATKILKFNVAAIATATTRTITWPNANITIPSTIASLAANTYTGLQTLNGGLSATTGTFSSTLGVTGNTTLSALLTVNGFGTHPFSAGGTGANVLAIRNTTAAQSAGFNLGTDDSAAAGYLRAYSSTHVSRANAVWVVSDRPGGLDLVAENAAGLITFRTGGSTARGTMTAAGVLDWLARINATVFRTTTALITAVDGSGTAAFTANMVGSTGGPVTAAQNGWLKAQDSTGATVWIPVWK